MFSPSCDMATPMASPMVVGSGASASDATLSASMSTARTSPVALTAWPTPSSSALCATPLVSCWNTSLRATKSVSLLSSTNATASSVCAIATAPSNAPRPAFLCALATPILRRMMAACSRSPACARSHAQRP
eukprot:3856108-Pleurochrysis_carterae.AAC.3